MTIKSSKWPPRGGVLGKKMPGFPRPPPSNRHTQMPPQLSNVFNSVALVEQPGLIIAFSIHPPRLQWHIDRALWGSESYKRLPPSHLVVLRYCVHHSCVPSSFFFFKDFTGGSNEKEQIEAELIRLWAYWFLVLFLIKIMPRKAWGHFVTQFQPPKKTLKWQDLTLER